MTSLEPVWQIGIVGLAMIVLIKFLDLAKLWWITRNGKGGLTMTALACQTDPEHYNRIKAMGKQMDWVYRYSQANEPALKKVREGIPAGEFGCTWKDRDEVLHMMQAIKDNTRAVTALTVEIRKQNGHK